MSIIEDHLHQVLDRKERMFKDTVVTEEQMWAEAVESLMAARGRRTNG